MPNTASVPTMFESHAQNCEDVVLWRVLGDVENGTYVDVGAADPDDDSVTKAFYERGWSGLNVEPADDYAERLRQARPRDVVSQVCAGAKEGSVTFHHVLGTGLSSVVESSIDSLASTEYEVVDVEVKVQRLDRILHDAGFEGRDIHFLKIDVEGFEESVLRGIDLAMWRPWVIVAEATAPNSTKQVHQSWEPLLLKSDYTFCLFDGLNRFYVAKEHAELAPALSYPASFFDQPFSTPSHAKLLRVHDNVVEGAERLRLLYETALQSYDTINDELGRSLESYQRLETVHQGTLDDYQRLEREYKNAIEGYDRLHRQYDIAIEDNSRLHRDVGDLTAERDTLRAGVASMSAEYDGLRAARDKARHELELTRQTLSWRATRPIRLVRRLLSR